MALHDSVLELIGRTPMVKARRLDAGVCELYLKLENANPGGSIKDRIGLWMIEAAEARGDIRPGATLVEGTAGNTGLGLALVAQPRQLRAQGLGLSGHRWWPGCAPGAASARSPRAGSSPAPRRRHCSPPAAAGRRRRRTPHRPAPRHQSGCGSR